MIVRSGNETVVRYNRGFILGLQVVGWVLILFAVAALGGALSGEVWWPGAVFFGVPSAYVVWRLFSMARSFSRSFVAIGPEGARLGLLKRTEGKAKWSLLREQRFKWEEIGHITYDSDKGVCRFRARDYTYELSPHFSPDFLGNDVAHALCVPRRHSWRRSGSERCVTARRSVENSLDTARVGACATSSGGL